MKNGVLNAEVSYEDPLYGTSVLRGFWKDVRVSVTQYFKELFTEMEEYGCLDASNDVDVFCLHYVFQPRINRCLNEFKTRWNLHKLSSENNKTPSQLYISGMLRRYGSSFREVKEVFDNDELMRNFSEMYSIEMQRTSMNMIQIPVTRKKILSTFLLMQSGYPENV